VLIESGRVVAVEPDAIWVETVRRSTCGACEARNGCGHGLLNRIGDGRRAYLRVLAGPSGTGACAVNDEVRFSIPEEVLLRGSALVYLLPLVSMLAGAALAVAGWPASPDPAAAAGAVTGLALGFALVRWHARRHRDDRSLQPVLLDVLSQPGASGGNTPQYLS